MQIFDFGRTPEGVFYYAMEYLEGIDLQTLVEKYGPQSPGRVIYLMRQMCGSLYEAHSKGLVHRDVKPANLFLTRRGGEADVVKVLDFGLVRAREEQRDGDADDRSMAGTPLYMSPEAIQMPGSVDGCSDIYAVGAVGYFLLTGRTPFPQGTMAEKFIMHQTKQPRSIRADRPEVPADLEMVVAVMLGKDPADRYQTPIEVAEALSPWTGAPLAPPSEEELPRLSRKARGEADTDANLGITPGIQVPRPRTPRPVTPPLARPKPPAALTPKPPPQVPVKPPRPVASTHCAQKQRLRSIEFRHMS